MKNTICLFLCMVAFGSCKDSSKENVGKLPSIIEVSKDSITNRMEDTIVDTKASDKTLAATSHQNEKRDSKTSHWSIDEFIIKCPKNYEAELKRYIEYERENWKHVANPFIAHYEGNDFGDYHHINFKDLKEKRYDFGFGNNDFGPVQLFYEDEQKRDNPKYLGKVFKIFWEWKISTFPCCSGDYELVEAYLPSIIKLTPI